MVSALEFVVLAQEGMTFNFLEENRHIIYPALAGVVVLLLAASVLSAWKTPEVAGVEKAETKGEIIRLMRRNIGWITASQVADGLDLETHSAATLLEEMKRDGLLVRATLENLVHYRLKG